MNFNRRIYAPLSVLFITVSALILSPVAFAADGEGTAGRIDDVYITYFCFSVIAL